MYISESAPLTFCTFQTFPNTVESINFEAQLPQFRGVDTRRPPSTRARTRKHYEARRLAEEFDDVSEMDNAALHVASQGANIGPEPRREQGRKIANIIERLRCRSRG